MFAVASTCECKWAIHDMIDAMRARRHVQKQGTLMQILSCASSWTKNFLRSCASTPGL